MNTSAVVAQIERLAVHAGGVVGASAEHLETGRTVAFNGDERFPMASTFKIAVAGAVLRKIDDGKLSLDRMISVDDAMRVDSDVIAAKFPHPGVALSVHNLLEVMLTQSDNTATDVLMTQAGGAEAVTAWLRSMDIQDQRVDRQTSELLTTFFALKPGQTLKDAFIERPELETLGAGPNPAYDDDPRDTSTPDAMVQLLKTLHSGGALSDELTKVLFDILGRCATGEARLKGRLPPKTVVTHKTGTIGGTVNDAGIITLPDGTHVAIAVFIKKSAAPFDARERAIADIARTVSDAFLLR